MIGKIEIQKTLTFCKEYEASLNFFRLAASVNFFRLSFCISVSCVFNCEDLLFIDFFIPRFKHTKFHVFIISEVEVLIIFCD